MIFTHHGSKQMTMPPLTTFTEKQADITKSRQFVSVIIPVLNSSLHLRHCLEALARQSYPEHSYEIIVIDNGSTENIEAVTSPFPLVRTVHEPQTGSYNARNTGFSAAKGEIIAFTDADCIPAENWIEEGVKALKSIPNCGLVAGDIQFSFRNPNCPNVIELCDSVMHLQQKYYLRDSHFGVTANMFTFKRIIEAVGCFDSTLKSGGDQEWGQRVFKAGYQQVYADQAKIQHPARYSFREFYTKVTRTARGNAVLRTRQHNTVEFVAALASDLKPPLKAILRIPTHKPWLKLKAALAVLGFRYLIAYEKANAYFKVMEESQ